MFLFLLQSFFMFLHVVGSGSFPQPLSPEEEKFYLDQLSSEDKAVRKQAKDILIEHNMRLVAHIVKKYNFKDNDDLISVGIVGLMKAIATFNSGKGTKLSTYAARCIENEILMYLRSLKKTSKEIFLQDPIGVDKEGKNITMEDRLEYESYSIDDMVGLKMQVKQLYEMIEAVLSDREKIIIKLRYGLNTGEEITQREIAKLLKISRSYVSRIEKRALKKLNKEFVKIDC